MRRLSKGENFIALIGLLSAAAIVGPGVTGFNNLTQHPFKEASKGRPLFSGKSINLTNQQIAKAETAIKSFFKKVDPQDRIAKNRNQVWKQFNELQKPRVQLIAVSKDATSLEDGSGNPALFKKLPKRFDVMHFAAIANNPKASEFIQVYLPSDQNGADKVLKTGIIDPKNLIGFGYISGTGKEYAQQDQIAVIVGSIQKANSNLPQPK